MALSNAPTSPNVHENWLFQFTADNNNCMVFNDGDNNYLNFGDIFNSFDTDTAGYTIEFWYQLESTGANPILSFGYNDSASEDETTNVQFNVSVASGDTIKLSWEHGNGTGKSEQYDIDSGANTWTHIAISRNNTDNKTRFYKNGAIVHTTAAETADPSGGTSSDMEFLVGRNQNYGSGNYFEGKMAHLRVWSTIRSDLEIERYYQRTVDSTATGLLGYWKLDEGSGDTVYDSSSSSNNGAVMNNNKVSGAGSATVWGNGDFDKHIHSFGLAFAHTVADSNTYYGSVLNKNITLRTSLDLANGTASTGNISVTSANFTFEGVDFYKHLFNHAERNYHNKEVRVFAQFNNNSSLSSCQRIFTGRLVEVTLNQDKTVTMQINTHRPWDGITFPQTRHSATDIYEPVVYGAFNYSDKVDASYGGVFPVPHIITEDQKIITLMPRSYSSGNDNYLHHYIGQDYFLAIDANHTTSGTEAEATAAEFGVNVLKTPVTYYAKGYIVPQHGNDLFERTELTDARNAFTKSSDGSWDTSTFAYYTHPDSGTGVHRYLQMMTVPSIMENTRIRKFKLRHGVVHTDGDGSGQFYQVDMYQNGSTLSSNRIYDNSSDSTGTVSGTGSTGSDTEFSLQTVATCPTELNLDFINDSASGYISEAHTLKLFGVKIFVSIRFWKADGTNNADDYNKLNNIKYFYCGGPGLTASWDSSAIEHGHTAHRDLLMRFAGMPSTDPTNWTNFHNDRNQTAWKARYWQLEPTSLKENLDKLAYEFGFNWKIDASGTLKYINVLQTGEYNTLRNATPSPIINLTGNDINKVNISTTGLNNLVTTMDIANNKHPAPDNRGEALIETSGKRSGYYTFTSISNANRGKYNHSEKEGIQEVSLDYNIGTPASNSDPNNNFYAYQNNLIGDMKIIVQCDVVNPAKGYQLETGDVVTFTDMPVEMFGTDFSTSTYFMIVELKRAPGKVSITAREVG